MGKEVYYNEIDKKASQWLRELIKDGLIPDGEVDERSIEDVKPEEVKGFTQCHFFAGVGGWAEALRLAGWGGRRAWSGSCPCQPFSVAGQRKGVEDRRHLWPSFFALIRACHPPVVFGEQVSSAIKHGWIDRVQADLEGEGYSLGYHVLGAHSVGSPHIRQRLYWGAIDRRPVGKDGGGRLEDSERPDDRGEGHGYEVPRKDSARPAGWPGRPGEAGRVADSGGAGAGERVGEVRGGAAEAHGDGDEVGLRDVPYPGRPDGGVAHAGQPIGRRAEDAHDEPGPGAPSMPGGTGALGGLADGAGVGCQPETRAGNGQQPEEHREGTIGERGDPGGVGNSEGDDQRGHPVPGEHREGEQAGGPGGHGFWESIQHYCQDGKVRRIPASVAAEPIFQRMADGVPCRVDEMRPESGFPVCAKVEGRVLLLKGYGNAIVPPLAAEFVKCFMEAISGSVVS